jgi:hypothetical protein
MVKNNSNWNIVTAADDVLSIDARLPENAVPPSPQQIQNQFDLGGSEAQMGRDQKQALQNKIEDLKKFEDSRGGVGSIGDEELVGVLRAPDEGLEEGEAQDIVSKYRKQYPSETSVEAPEQTAPQEMFPAAIENEDFGGPSAPIGQQIYAKYKGKYAKEKTKKHLKGKGPKADKANEVYHAIMRDRDGKGEPTKEEQASAAAIAWSQAKKTMKKKAFFRGEEIKVLDSYRGMWGEELVRVSMQGQVIDITRDSIEFVSTETIDPVAQLKDFVSHISDDADTKSQIKANIANLRIAKDIAYQLIVSASEDLSSADEASIDAVHVSCENRISEFEHRLTNFASDEDETYVTELPKYEIGREVSSSSFSRDSDGWMDEVIEKMAAEAEGLDIEKLANEDPIVFVNSLSDEVIADAPTVRRLAMERVGQAAGALDEETKQAVISKYIEKTEVIRKKAFSILKQKTAQEVDEQIKTANSTPDEGLFL